MKESVLSRHEDELVRLRSRLPKLWTRINAATPWEHTSVVVPSLSFHPAELAKIPGVTFYEERLLFTLMRLRHPLAHVVYVISQPIHPDIIDYYLQLLVGVPAAHARRRLTLVCLYDGSAKPLTQKVLERPRVVERLRRLLGNPGRAYLTCFNATTLEEQLALRLGIPLNAAGPELFRFGTKSGSRDVFARAGVPHPAGTSDLRSERAVAEALAELAERNPRIRRAVVKLNESFAGEGNAVFSFPEDTRQRTADEIGIVLAERLLWSSDTETFEHFVRKIEEMGCIVEEHVEGDEVHSPSVQLRVTPVGDVEILSTHDQVLGGPAGQEYMGCRFPASEDYRAEIQRDALAIGEVLRGLGVVSRLGVDFVVARNQGESWRRYAIEINLRMGGTTHPFLALQFLTGGELDRESGLFLAPRGTPKYYFSTDGLTSPAYRGLLPEDLLEMVTLHGLGFQPSSEKGVLLHMIGAISQFGKVGVTCIGDSRDEADALYRWTTSVLDRETGAAEGRRGELARLFERRLPRME